MEKLFNEIRPEKMWTYIMRGVQINGKDLTVIGYIQEVLDFVKKRVKEIPPFKRRIVDLKGILDKTLEITEHCECGVVD